MANSSKFRLLKAFRQHKDLRENIPEYFDIPLGEESHISPELFDRGWTFILRSALVGESETELKSGKSISIPEIRTYGEFLSALKRIKTQPGLCEIILQQQILND